MKLLKLVSKRGLALLVTLMMCLSLLPGVANAMDAPYNGAQITNISRGTVGQGITGPGPEKIVKVGEQAHYLTLPPRTYYCYSCKAVLYRTAPKYYNMVSLKSYDDTIIQNDGYQIGTWAYNSSDGFGGSDCLDWVFTGLMPGSTTAQLHYYTRYDNSFSDGICPYCRRDTYAALAGQQSWGVYYEYQYNIPVYIYATYVLNYDTQGGTRIPSTSEDKAKLSHDMTITSQEPSKTGFIFKGWAESADAKEAQYTGGEKITLDWESGSTVSQTLYAVWEEDNTPVTKTVTLNLEFQSNDSDSDVKVDEGTMPETMTRTVTVTEGQPVEDVVFDLIQVKRPTRTGYDFKGWQTVGTSKPSSTSTFYADEISEVVSENNPSINHYAKAIWEKDTPILPESPTKEQAAAALDGSKITVNCTNSDATHSDKTKVYGVTAGNISYIDPTVTVNDSGVPTVKVRVSKQSYVPLYNADVHVEHALSGKTELWERTLTYVDGQWTGSPMTKTVEVVCTQTAGCPHPDNNTDHHCADCWHNGVKDSTCNNDACLNPNEHPDENEDLICDVPGCNEKVPCTHEPGGCVDKEDCEHHDDCPCKQPVTKPGHTHVDEGPEDGICDDPACGACLHPHNATTGDCIVDGCDHEGLCCNKGTTEPEDHKHTGYEDDGICDTCGKCMHEHVNGYCTDPNCKGEGVHKDCCAKEPPAEPETYTVTFCANGGVWKDSSDPDKSFTAKANGSVEVPDAPTRKGYTFNGWTTLGKDATTVTVIATVTYYAQWMPEATEPEEPEEPEVNASAKITKGTWNVNGKVEHGARVFYNAVLTNDGNCDLHNLVIQDTMDTGLTLADANAFITVLAPNGDATAIQNELVNSHSREGQVSTWTLANFPVGTTITLMYSATVDEDAPDNRELVNHIRFDADDPTDEGYESVQRSGRLLSAAPIAPRKVSGEDSETIVVECTHSSTHRANETAATCGSDGSYDEVCNTCGDTVGHGTIPATGNHNMVETSRTEPTCTAGGSVTSTCSVCGHPETATNGAALGHDMGEWYSIGGNQEQRDCSRCDYSETRTVTPTDPTPDPIPDPTPVTPTPTPTTPTPTPAPAGTDEGEDISDENPPLASAIGLNKTEHFAYVIGDPDGKVRPMDKITRAEVSTIFFRLMTDEYRIANWATTNGFSDVEAGTWYNNAISTCANAALVEGDPDGSFRPESNITHAEFVTLAARFLGDEVTGANVGDFKDTEGHWAAEAIRRAAEAGWITWANDGYFRPDEYITRAEVMSMINRMLDRTPDAEHMLPDMKTWVDNPEGTSYYADVQEATNGHDYDYDTEMGVTEIWTAIQAVRDWKALETEWANNGGASAK